MKPILRPLLLIPILAGATMVLAQSAAPLAPAQFAWQWPLQADPGQGAVRFGLTPEVYTQLTRADLRDLAAFNAAGESMPLGPAHQAFDRLALPPEPTAVNVPMFRIPAAATPTAGDAVSLHLQRAPDGTLLSLDADVVPGAEQAAAVDVVLDLSALDAAITRLQLEIDPGAIGTLHARVEVAGSVDLVQWTVLAPTAALISLDEGGRHLYRNQIDLAPTAFPYLRLRRVDAGQSLPLESVQAWPVRSAAGAVVAPQREVRELQGTAVADSPGVFDYDSGGPFPIEAIEVQLADRNSTADVALSSRHDAGAPWQTRTSITAFRLAIDGDEITSGPLSLSAQRDRHWRVATQPAQARAPVLRVSHRPDQFVLLTQGEPPYRLAAGSRDALRPDYPMRSVLAGLASRYGDTWLPPTASLGPGATLSGEAALIAPPPPPPYKQWLLWGVLIGAAVAIVVMVLKLMRGGGTSQDGRA
jgi:hypothetical protein